MLVFSDNDITKIQLNQHEPVCMYVCMHICMYACMYGAGAGAVARTHLIYNERICSSNLRAGGYNDNVFFPCSTMVIV